MLPMLFPENLHQGQMHGLHPKLHPWHPSGVLLLTKFELRLAQSLLRISLQGRLMGQSWALEPKMLLPNKNEHESRNKSGRHSYKLLEQTRQPDKTTNKGVRIPEDLPPAVAAEAAVRIPMSATGVLIRIRALTQKIRPIGRTSILVKLLDFCVQTMKLISVLLFGNYMSVGGMPAHHR